MERKTFLKKKYFTVFGIQRFFILVCAVAFFLLFYTPITEQVLLLYDNLESDFEVLQQMQESQPQFGAAQPAFNFVAQLAIIGLYFFLFLALCYAILFLMTYLEIRYVYKKKPIRKKEWIRFWSIYSILAVSFFILVFVSIFFYSQEALFLPSVILYTMLSLFAIVLWSLYFYVISQAPRFVLRAKLSFEKLFLYTVLFFLILLPFIIIQTYGSMFISLGLFLVLQTYFLLKDQ